MQRKQKFTDDTVETKKLVHDKYFMNYTDYCEVLLLMKEEDDGFCYRCGKMLDSLTYMDPDFFYVPCWDCLSRRKSDKGINTESIVRALKDFYSNVSGDRYYQLFIVDDIYFKTTLPHDYMTFKKVIGMLDPPSRNDIWFIDWIPGYPKIISPENINGLKIVNITDVYKSVSYEPDLIRVGEYEIRMPEFTTFNQKHHSSYSILNKNGDRKSKRLKLGDRCVRFYNTDDPEVKAIFKIYKNGEEVALRSISYQDYVIIKLALMRNKTFIRLVFDIIEEVSKSVGTLRDSVFLKNTVRMNSKLDSSVTIIWTLLSEYKNQNNINISIF